MLTAICILLAVAFTLTVALGMCAAAADTIQREHDAEEKTHEDNE